VGCFCDGFVDYRKQAMNIKPTCPHCGRILTIKIPEITKLRAELEAAQQQIRSLRGKPRDWPMDNKSTASVDYLKSMWGIVD
jgi:hypothetical protein